MQIEVIAGRQNYSNGVVASPSMDNDGTLMVEQGHAKYYASAVRKTIYTATIPVVGVAPGTALGTLPPWCLYNPPSSGVNLVLLSLACGYVSGTLGAGTIALCWNTQLVAPSGGGSAAPLVVTQSNLASSPGKASACTLTTVTTAGLLLEPVFNLGAALATTALGISFARVDIDGRYIVPPGTYVALQGIAAAGTSPLVILQGSWEEQGV